MPTELVQVRPSPHGMLVAVQGALIASGSRHAPMWQTKREAQSPVSTHVSPTSPAEQRLFTQRAPTMHSNDELHPCPRPRTGTQRIWAGLDPSQKPPSRHGL